MQQGHIRIHKPTRLVIKGEQALTIRAPRLLNPLPQVDQAKHTPCLEVIA